jgi:hypothetical protein
MRRTSASPPDKQYKFRRKKKGQVFGRGLFLFVAVNAIEAKQSGGRRQRAYRSHGIM